jgi:hypothetical protein
MRVKPVTASESHSGRSVAPVESLAAPPAVAGPRVLLCPYPEPRGRGILL